MKLIVLYGPENSGKTTTLKMVYDELKKINILETNCFRYLDKEPDEDPNGTRGVDTWRLDFLDVLYVLKEDLSENEYNNMSILCNLDHDSLEETIRGWFADVEQKMKEYEKEQSTAKNTIPKNHADVKHLVCRSRPIKPENLFSVGIATQGDYGFSTTRKHALDLSKHLDSLEGCDIIVCACTQRSIDPPLNCVVHFIMHHIKQIDQIAIVSAIPFPLVGGDKNVKTAIERKRTSAILSLLRIMM